MAKVRQNEVLGKALPSDAAVIPRFNIKAADGTTMAENTTIELANPVITEGMAVDKTAMDECLSASGRAGGTKKALTLQQENYALFDGAVVRIQLFDQMSGATTLNVNGTGAKCIKTLSGEDPDGLTKDSWVDLVYSQVRDQYIVQGGGGGNAALSQSVNLLEELINMKYCKVFTTQSPNADLNAEWMVQGVLHGCCDTTNYRWYARVRANSNLIEFRRVHKTTKAVEEFSGTFNSVWMTTISVGSAEGYYAYPYGCKLQLIPIRNGDAVIWYATACAVNYQSRSNYYTWVAYGLVFPDKTVLVESQDNGSDTTVNYDQTYTQFATMNGYYYGGFMYVALPRSLHISGMSQGIFCTPCILSCYNASTHAQVWRYSDGYSDGPVYGSSAYGRFIWVISQTKAVLFATYRKGSDDYEDQSARVCATLTFSSSAAPSSYTAVGSSIAAPCGGLSYSDKQSNGFGWWYDAAANKISLMCRAQNVVGTSSAAGLYVNIFTYNITGNSLTYTSKKLSADNSPDTELSHLTFLPGYVSEAVCLITSAAYGENSKNIAGVLLNLNDDSSGNFVNGSFINVAQLRLGNDGESHSYYWDTFEGPGTVTVCATGDKCVVTDNSGVYDQNLSEAIAASSEIIWTCPADGVYKLIAVGGGANGSTSYGGGAGYLTLATTELAEGERVHIKLGRGGIAMPVEVSDVIQGRGKAQSTYAYKEGSPDEYLIFAAAAQGNQGGATGAATASGGGAGGYDLVQYGGQGMNYMPDGSTTFTVSSSSATIRTGNIALSKDRNGGVSANAGAVTSGDGYGAGGGMNQNGKDGCLVIIR